MLGDDHVRLPDMIDEAETAVAFVAGRSQDDLDRDRMLFHALVRAIEVMGEAASRLSVEARAVAPQVPWRDIVSMRNRLIHGYAAIDPDALWKTATEDIPALLPLLRALATSND
ncbi:MAG: DUF86 domain-containing protein [Candidatus Schekmanbacteria bacterium]|nr:DUF86 domain-containing protein [Candidatus Schekmanbacteria bacterium]